MWYRFHWSFSTVHCTWNRDHDLLFESLFSWLLGLSHSHRVLLSFPVALFFSSVWGCCSVILLFLAVLEILGAGTTFLLYTFKSSGFKHQRYDDDSPIHRESAVHIMVGNQTIWFSVLGLSLDNWATMDKLLNLNFLISISKIIIVSIITLRRHSNMSFSYDYYYCYFYYWASLQGI